MICRVCVVEEEIRRPPPESAKPPVEHVPEPVALEEGKKEPVLSKRTSEPSEDAPEIKKPCIVEEPAVLEDALSEISDDADEILNREDVRDYIIRFIYIGV